MTFRHVYVEALLQNSYPALSGLTAVDGFGVEGLVLGTSWTTSGLLGPAGLPYLVLQDAEWLPGAALTLDPGVVVKADNARLTLRGGLQIPGGAEGVRFTSFADDVLADSNDDGAATSPQPGDWSGILIDTPGVIMDWHDVTVAYADDAVELRADVAPALTCRIEGATFEHNVDGLVVEGDHAEVVVVSSLFADHERAVVVGGGGTVSLGDLSNPDPADDGGNAFACNTIHVETLSAPVPAENDWWGEAPPDPARFVGPVDTDPFLAEAPMPLFLDLRLERLDQADVRLTWEDRLPACGYRVTRGPTPQGVFGDVSGPLASSQYVDAGAGQSPDDYYYLIAPNP